MKYSKKPVVIEATRWFKNGDHPDVDGGSSCKHCDEIMHNHGWIDTLEGGHIVCPGDWIITGIKGEIHPCKNDVFEATYEKVEMK